MEVKTQPEQSAQPAPVEVCERLKKEEERAVENMFRCQELKLHDLAEVHSVTLAAIQDALLLIEQGEKERERISKAFDLLLNAIPKDAVKHLDMGNLMAAVKLVPGCLILPEAARAQPTPESK